MRISGALAVLALATSLGSACATVESPLNPTPTPVVDTSARTEAFSSNVAVSGISTRSFIVLTDGVVTLTLISAGPPTTVALGMGLGIPRTDGTGCNLSTTVNTPAGSTAQLTATVDAGTYCVSIYDLGTLTATVNFSVAIFHP